MNRDCKSRKGFARSVVVAAVSATLGVVGLQVHAAETGVGLAAQHDINTLFEYAGHISQDGAAIQAFGYLTYVQGLSQSELFWGGPPYNESNAKFTFVTSGNVEAQQLAAGTNGVFNLVMPSETTTFYLRAPGGGGCIGEPNPPSCDPNAAAFSNGTPIAHASGRGTDVTRVIAANTAVVDGVSDLEFESVSFRAAGIDAFPLWRKGVTMRSTYSGKAFRTALTPTSYSIVSGRGEVVR